VSANDIARVYASSLIEIGQQNNILLDIEEEIKFLADLITENDELRQFLGSPGIPKDAKKDFIDKVFKGKLSETMTNFMKVLIDNDRQSCIVDIYHAVVESMDDVYKRQRVTVISSVVLDPSLKNKLLAKLKDILKKDIILNEEIDKEILGGIIIKIGDTVIDGSLVKDLKNITNNMLNSKVRSELAYED
jgi:F-type H+-transporting ATPase subunit delta